MLSLTTRILLLGFHSKKSNMTFSIIQTIPLILLDKQTNTP